MMRSIVKSSPAFTMFLLVYFFLFVTGIVMLVTMGKVGSFLMLNNFHRNWLDQIFIVYTNAGDGLFAIVICLFLFFILKKRKPAVVLLLAYSFTGIIAQVIKRIVESPRPKSFFYPKHYPFFIDDIMHSGNTSFPSGHTATAFAMATVLAFFIAEKRYAILFLVLAIMVGFSRIYLSQHFLTDVLAGSIIGVLGSIVCVYWCRNINEERLVLRRQKGNGESNR